MLLRLGSCQLTVNFILEGGSAVCNVWGMVSSDPLGASSTVRSVLLSSLDVVCFGVAAESDVSTVVMFLSYHTSAKADKR